MKIEVGHHTFDVLVQGPEDAPVVLLLHGFPQSGHSWRLVLPRLADFRVVVPDQRGYSPGARPQKVEDYRLAELVADALGILDALEVEQAHVVGHDWGAAVAWHLGARHPGRVRTLAPLSVPHPVAFLEALRIDEGQRARSRYMRDFSQPGYADELLAQDAAGFRSALGTFPPAVDVEHMLERAREQGALAAMLRWYAAQRREDVQDTPDVVVPTMHVWSDGDRALGRTAAELTASHVTGPYRFEVLRGVSHWIPEEAADRLAELLLEHLRAG